jgi:spore germination cell wall hydrolase CwlJ-like protein
MGILKKFIENYREKKEKEKEFESEIRMQRKVMEKFKDADERELERYMEEAHKLRVHAQLEKLRKNKAKKIWTENPFSNNKNLFKNKPMFKCRSVK